MTIPLPYFILFYFSFCLFEHSSKIQFPKIKLAIEESNVKDFKKKLQEMNKKNNNNNNKVTYRRGSCWRMIG